MKIRNGFVSNSSSSSFIAVCTRKHNIIAQVLTQWGFNSEEELCEAACEGITDFSSTNYGIVCHKPSGLHVYATCGEVYWVGLDIENELRKDKRVSECKADVVRMFAKAGIKLTSNDLEFESGTCSSE